MSKVLNITHYDSEDTEDSDIIENIDNNLRPSSPDEETDDLFESLELLLENVGTLSCLGKKYFRIEFYDTKFDFLDKEEECEFDYNEENFPVLHEGSQEYIIPYLYCLSDYLEDIKDCNFETNKDTVFTI